MPVGGRQRADLRAGQLSVRDSYDLRGTFAPDRRACDRPIAIACLRLVTLRLDRPERSVPRLRSRIADLTFVDAAFPYLR